jgi:hypothetical protein
MFDGAEHPSGGGDFASRMIGNVPPRPVRARPVEAALCGFVLVCPSC